MAETKAVGASQIFTGETWLNDHALIIDNGIIASIVPLDKIPGEINYQKFEGLLVPAFIDLQLYGANGHLLSEYPTVETLEAIYQYSVKGGAHYCLPTVATNTYDVFYKSIDAAREYSGMGKPGILGLHIEGPWISKKKRGAHVPELIHTPTLKQTEELLNYGKGIIKMITLAPEVCSKEIIELIRSNGVVISAGHSNAGFKESTNSFNNGISAVTHLYNAMSGLHHREPGLVGAAFQHTNVMASIIPDGHHVHFEAIKIAKKIMGDRLFIITDAVTDTSTGHYQHHLQGDKYISGGILSGSALNMAKAVKSCIENVGIEPGEALRMASLYPAKVLGLDDKIGRLHPGFPAVYTLMNNKFEVVS